MEHDSTLAEFILHDPGKKQLKGNANNMSVMSSDEAQRRLATFLTELKQISVGDRVWLRITQVFQTVDLFLLKAEQVPFPLKTMKQIGCGWPKTGVKKIPAHVCGIISGVCCVKNQVYCRELQCVYCGENKWKMELFDMQDGDEICCGDQALATNYEERKQSRSLLSCDLMH